MIIEFNNKYKNMINKKDCFSSYATFGMEKIWHISFLIGNIIHVNIYPGPTLYLIVNLKNFHIEQNIKNFIKENL